MTPHVNINHNPCHRSVTITLDEFKGMEFEELREWFVEVAGGAPIELDLLRSDGRRIMMRKDYTTP